MFDYQKEFTVLNNPNSILHFDFCYYEKLKRDQNFYAKNYDILDKYKSKIDVDWCLNFFKEEIEAIEFEGVKLGLLYNKFENAEFYAPSDEDFMLE